MKSITHIAVAFVLYATPLAAQEQVSGVPWTVAIVPSVNPVPVGSCSQVSLTLKDSTGKDAPRTSEGWRVSIADFDMTVASASNIVGVYNGPASWSVCACQGATAASQATVTAIYPAQALAAKSRVSGVAGQWTLPLSVAAAKGTFNPPGCGTRASSSSASTASTGLTLVAAPLATASPASVVTGPAVGAGSGDAISTMFVGGSAFVARHVEGGSAVMSISTAGGTITRTGKITYEPIVVDVQPGSPLDARINQAWLGTPMPMSGSISQKMARPPLTQLSFSGATIVSTTIPTLDASAKDAVWLRVTLVPTTASEISGTAPAAPFSGTRSWGMNQIPLTIPGLNTTGVARIESFVVGQQTTLDPSTGQTSSKASAGPSAVTKLFVTVTEATAGDWIAWLKATVSGSAPSEKTMSLDLRSIDNIHLATIEGSGLGIVALRTQTFGESLRRVQAELYVRKLQLLP
ncbi:MAG: hypothetical protein JWL95_1683 [Gemmatimonadetes bacterium]|nr:hypothetical protein [Gemmatimonadota bacterium]